jgi:two-component system, chemotaxis family, CheB/CheR fusion protein
MDETVVRESPGLLRRYIFALFCFAAGLLTRLAFSGYLGTTLPFITFFPGVMLSAWYGGLGPGLLTTLLGGAAAQYFVLTPDSLRPVNFPVVAPFLIVSSVLSWLFEQLHRARRRVESELKSRSQADADRRASEERYRIMAEAASDGIVTIDDEQSRILYCNPAVAEMFGYTRDEISSHSLTMLMPEYLRHVHETSLKRYVETGKKHLDWHHIELPGLHKTRGEFAIEVSFGEYVSNGRHFFTGVVRNVTERKRFEEQMRESAKLESLGVLAGGVAHDFNNLLTGIMGNASLAAEMLPAGNPTLSMLQNVVEASDRASTLTRQLLAYAGKGRFVIEPVNLSELADGIRELISTSIPKNVHVRLDLQKDLPRISGDASQLQQVVINLVINGAESVPAGGEGTVKIRTGIQEVDAVYIDDMCLPPDFLPGRYVSLEISDTGAGMDQATVERIFDPFFTTKFTGRGLGLAAVQGIVRSHKGAMKVYSTPGKGTTFKILFPVAAELSEEEPSARSDGTHIPHRGLVLVIDDEEIVRKVAKTALERKGFSVLLAADGSTGVALFQSKPRQITGVILDLTMPGLNGEEALKRLQSIQPDVKVILSSGYDERELKRRFAGAGLAGFVQKPYAPAALVEMVEQKLCR